MWFYAALGMALVSAVYTVVSKHALRKIDPIIFFWLVILVSAIFILPFVWSKGLPDINYIFILGVTGSVVFYSASKVIYYNVLKKNDLSKVYPLMSLSPIFTLIFSMLLFSERPSHIQYLAMGITLLGAYILNISSLREGILEPFKMLFEDKAAFWMLVSVGLVGVVSVFDKLAIANTFPKNEAFSILAENFLIVIAFLPWIWAKRKDVYVQFMSNKKIIILLGALMTMDTLLAFFALGAGDAGIVISIFRTQIFFVLLLGFVFLKDKPKFETILGSIIMISGIVLLKLAGN